MGLSESPVLDTEIAYPSEQVLDVAAAIATVQCLRLKKRVDQLAIPSLPPADIGDRPLRPPRMFVGEAAHLIGSLATGPYAKRKAPEPGFGSAS
jgi:hypothetical protein